MKRRFIIVVNPGTTEQEQAMKNLLTRFGWWHWISGVWLVVDRTGTMTAESFRELTNTAFPGLSNLVIEVPEVPTHERGMWAGFGPSTPPRDMGEWIRNNWDA